MARWRLAPDYQAMPAGRKEPHRLHGLRLPFPVIDDRLVSCVGAYADPEFAGRVDLRRGCDENPALARVGESVFGTGRQVHVEQFRHEVVKDFHLGRLVDPGRFFRPGEFSPGTRAYLRTVLVNDLRLNPVLARRKLQVDEGHARFGRCRSEFDLLLKQRFDMSLLGEGNFRPAAWR